MIQFNLLPDIKVDYIKTRKLKHVIMLLSIVAAGISIGIVAITFSYAAVQKGHVSHLNSDIAAIKDEINAIPDLKKILSVQNQLNTLPALYDGRPAVDRLPAYLDQITPGDVGISDLTVDFSASTMEIRGKAPTLEAVNRYADTLKFTSYKAGTEGETKPALKDVVLASFGRDDTGAAFTITLGFDPTIFDSTKEVQLSVPSAVTTRSQLTLPTNNLFNGTQEATEGEQ